MRLLIVDDEPNILTMVRRALELEGHAVEVAGGGRIALEKLRKQRFDATLLDVSMPDLDGLCTLREIAQINPELPVIMMSGNATLAQAVEATRLGARDFLEKPLSTEKLLLTLQNTLKLTRLEKENARQRQEKLQEMSLVGGSSATQHILNTIARAAPTLARVLITGERGTGKELVARAVHEGSKRSDGPFIKVNSAAIPSELIESELFGHEKGAFTGATRERRGKFELADGGTLFLDEIGDMTLSAQAKMLRALQENEIERVGGSEVLQVDVRVVAATNKDLAQEIQKGTFRADLFDRLNVVPIFVKPLRERKEDVPALVKHFVELLAGAAARPVVTVQSEAISLLQQYDWPGNVRELRNTIERLLIFCDAHTITADTVAQLLPQVQVSRTPFRKGVALKDLVASAERDFIAAALESNQHHMAQTARELGLERSHLYKKMRSLGLKPGKTGEVSGEGSDAESDEDDSSDDGAAQD